MLCKLTLFRTILEGTMRQKMEEKKKTTDSKTRKMKELLPTAAHAKTTGDECSCASWALQNFLLYVKCER